MILSDRDIRRHLHTGHLVIDPPPSDEAIQPASIDLHLGTEFRYLHGVPLPNPGDRILLLAGHFVLAHTHETVTIPDDLVAQLDGKSTLARLGMSIHQTAGWIDPGFTGHITLELHNCAPRPISLVPGMPIGQLVLMRLTTRVLRPYGSPGLGSHYQGQTGATPSAQAGHP